MKIQHSRRPYVLGLLVGILVFTTSSVGAQSTKVENANQIVSLPLILRNFEYGPTSFAGQVVDATTNKPINNAQVCLTTSILPSDTCVITEEDGNYLIEGVIVGVTHTLMASHDDYFEITKVSAPTSGMTKTINFALPPTVLDGDYLILLTWSSTEYWSPGEENDLDAYLWTPYKSDVDGDSAVGENEFTVIYQAYRGFKDQIPFVFFDVDVRLGSGPETITIVQKKSGIYSYGVENVNAAEQGVPFISGTSANVKIYDVSGKIDEFNVPQGGNKDFWYVFDLDADSGTITAKNCLIDYPDLADKSTLVCP